MARKLVLWITLSVLLGISPDSKALLVIDSGETTHDPNPITGSHFISIDDGFKNSDFVTGGLNGVTIVFGSNTTGTVAFSGSEVTVSGTDITTPPPDFIFRYGSDPVNFNDMGRTRLTVDLDPGMTAVSVRVTLFGDPGSAFLEQSVSTSGTHIFQLSDFEAKLENVTKTVSKVDFQIKGSSTVGATWSNLEVSKIPEMPHFAAAWLFLIGSAFIGWTRRHRNRA